MLSHQEKIREIEVDLDEQEISKDFTLTTNGAVSYSSSHFLQDDQSSLLAYNVATVTKDDYETSKQYFEKILDGKNKIAKVYAIILLFHIRDIEFGKGLRKPFTEGLILLGEKGYSELVNKLIPHIYKFGYYKDLSTLYLRSTELKRENLYLKSIVESFKEGLNHESMQKGQFGMRNCAKFAPKQQKKFSKLAYHIAISLFPGSNTQMKDYRQYLQSITKKYAQITENLMSSQNWDQIDPQYVPSLCFQKYKKCFLKSETDDEKRKILKQKYEEHINKALEKKDGAKINAKRLMINQIVEEAQKNFEQELEKKAIEAQYMDILSDLQKNAQLLQQCICMCDVSGSMSGIPMNACIGLGIVINDLNENKSGKSIMTFSQNPVWVDLTNCNTFIEKVNLLQNSQWGMNTDFYKAMKLIADSYKKNIDTLPKAIFVFSDMQFDEADGREWGTTMDKIKQYFVEKGFEINEIPTIIFWNLRSGSNNFVVDTHQEGAICLSGFSQNLLKAITTSPDIDYILNLNPFTFLIETLNNKRYDHIRQICLESIQ